jgi:hypothetical protein
MLKLNHKAMRGADICDVLFRRFLIILDKLRGAHVRQLRRHHLRSDRLIERRSDDRAQRFVAVLGASSPTYAEGIWT